MVNCWAKTLGGCSDKVSREHLVSRALFVGDTITVQGLPWCKGGAKTIGLANLTAKILCRRHNSELSELDSAALKVFDAFREAARLSNVRSKLRPSVWNPKRIVVNGGHLERWFLKTLINVAYEGEYYIGPRSTESGTASADLVRKAFGLKAFDEGEGIYIVGNVGQQINSQDMIRLVTLVATRPNKYIAGALFIFRGYRFFLNLHVGLVSRLPEGLGVPGENWGRATLLYRGKRIRQVVGKHLSSVITFDWKASTRHAKSS
jgi:hypothetical protein